MLRMANPVETERKSISGCRGAGGGEGGEWGVTANEYTVSFSGDENVLESDSGDGGTTLRTDEQPPT